MTTCATKSKKIQVIEYRTEIDFPVWMYTVHGVLSSSIDKSAQRLRIESAKADLVIDEGNCGGMHMHHNGNESWIILELDPTSSSIAHESFHAIFRMFKYAGAKLENETFAYHLGYLVKHLTLFVMKYEKSCAKACHQKRKKS